MGSPAELLLKARTVAMHTVSLGMSLGVAGAPLSFRFRKSAATEPANQRSQPFQLSVLGFLGLTYIEGIFRL